jgi:hypothetical protein
MLDYFSLSLAILFTIYALDLLFLVVVSAIARRAEEKSGVSMSKPDVPGARYHRPDSPSWATHKDDHRGKVVHETVLHDTELRDALRVDGYGDSSRWPKVLIQLPMYNEENCCDLIIERICRVLYPRDRLLIQVSAVR